ncbi:unnamed protein product [Porites lobata]|uniref:Uncharacterized protein n=1 Tax=Porites lobata TaxID=104759 RepID=A0ABN8QMS1_9CNID|nr:unnamed protein product [Porites lobata]
MLSEMFINKVKPSDSSSEVEAVSALQKCICDVRAWMREDQLMLNDGKTQFLIIGYIIKILHGLSPKYLSDLISVQQPSSYYLRRNDNGRLLERPSVKTKKTLGDRAFQVAAPFLSFPSCQGPRAKQRT